MIVDVEVLDRHLKFLRNEVQALRSTGKKWAGEKADRFERIHELLLALRQDHQMRGVTGERIDGG